MRNGLIAVGVILCASLLAGCQPKLDAMPVLVDLGGGAGIEVAVTIPICEGEILRSFSVANSDLTGRPLIYERWPREERFVSDEILEFTITAEVLALGRLDEQLRSLDSKPYPPGLTEVADIGRLYVKSSNYAAEVDFPELAELGGDVYVVFGGGPDREYSVTETTQVDGRRVIDQWCDEVRED